MSGKQDMIEMILDSDYNEGNPGPYGTHRRFAAWLESLTCKQLRSVQKGPEAYRVFLNGWSSNGKSKDGSPEGRLVP